MPENQTRNTSDPSSRSPGGRGGESYTDQVQGALRGAADSASDMWDDAYEQGQRYYRQGTQAVGEVDTATLSGWLIAGAIGFGLGWLMFGAASRSADDMTRRMAESGHRYRGPEERRFGGRG
jgi:hypothetical protein